MSTLAIPQAFLWRRLHSLMGLWLVLFLCEHLLTNSQAALWLGDHGKGFVSMVNGLHNLPYLQVIEFTLLGIPFLIHMVWGVKYLLTAKFNSGATDGSAPSLPLRRNRAYTWQRITSWFLLIAVLLHVAKFRFLQYPETVSVNAHNVYLTPLTTDPGLSHLAHKLHVALYGAKEIHHLEVSPLRTALEKHSLSPHTVIAASPDFGTAQLLVVRNTFKQPIYIVLYTLFVLAACFHAANGFWTFLITWGWVLRMAAQRAWTTVSVVLMAALLFLGLAAVWGTYFNLRQ